MENIWLGIAFEIGSRHHEADVIACNNCGRLNGFRVVYRESAASACNVCVFRAIDWESLLPEAVVRPRVPRDVANVLEFFGDSVVDYEAIEYILRLVSSGISEQGGNLQ